jgi:uncharacterized cupredoxin-like copper-binding protein
MLSVRRVMNLAWLGATIATGFILLAACGGSGTKYSSAATSTPRSTTSAGTTPTGAGATVKVTLKEWTLTPDKASVPAGDITFSATNSGTIDHEFVVFKTDLAPDALKLSGTAVDEAASGQTKVDEIAEFAPGTTKTLTLNLQPGKYVLICNVAGHYQRGVSSAFTVTATAAASRNY